MAKKTRVSERRAGDLRSHVLVRSNKTRCPAPLGQPLSCGMPTRALNDPPLPLPAAGSAALPASRTGSRASRREPSPAAAPPERHAAVPHASQHNVARPTQSAAPRTPAQQASGSTAAKAHGYSPTTPKHHATAADHTAPSSNLSRPSNALAHAGIPPRSHVPSEQNQAWGEQQKALAREPRADAPARKPRAQHPSNPRPASTHVPTKGSDPDRPINAPSGEGVPPEHAQAGPKRHASHNVAEPPPSASRPSQEGTKTQEGVRASHSRASQQPKHHAAAPEQAPRSSGGSGHRLSNKQQQAAPKVEAERETTSQRAQSHVQSPSSGIQAHISGQSAGSRAGTGKKKKNAAAEDTAQQTRQRSEQKAELGTGTALRPFTAPVPLRSVVSTLAPRVDKPSNMRSPSRGKAEEDHARAGSAKRLGMREPRAEAGNILRSAGQPARKMPTARRRSNSRRAAKEPISCTNNAKSPELRDRKLGLPSQCTQKGFGAALHQEVKDVHTFIRKFDAPYEKLIELRNVW